MLERLLRKLMFGLPLGFVALLLVALPAKSESLDALTAVAVGEVTAETAVFWVRDPRAMQGELVLFAGSDEAQLKSYQLTLDPERDFTARVILTELLPDTEYRYRWSAAEQGPDNIKNGRFTTAPSANTEKPVRFAWSGDLMGKNVCRDAVSGFPIIPFLAIEKIDFLVLAGNSIHAQSDCLESGHYGNIQIDHSIGVQSTVSDFWSQWKYVRMDQGVQGLLASAPYYSTWNDHEVRAGFGPQNDHIMRTVSINKEAKDEGGKALPNQVASGPALMPLGLQAYLDYTPFVPADETPKRLYRSVKRGKLLEMFILDVRQYRDPAGQLNSEGMSKTMLGREQAAWLAEKVAASDSLWKIIVSSVPLSVPLGDEAQGYQGWANMDSDSGYEQELQGLLKGWQQAEVKNLIWLGSSINFATGFEYHPFKHDPQFRMFELLAGPLNGQVGSNPQYDKTLRPKRIYRHVPSSAKLDGHDAAVSWFNYGVVNIDESGQLLLEIKNGLGELVHSKYLSAQ